MTLNDLDFLSSDEGQQLLARLSRDDLSDSNTLPLLTKLREQYTAQQSGSAVTMARLRLKAVAKFGENASQMFFTKNALQQASHPLVRQYRAEKLRDTRILDVCCGIGADSLAFAQNNNQVLGLDIDPLRIEIAQFNADVLGLGHVRFEIADVRDKIPNDYETIFFDPARRNDNGKRIFDVEKYIPPLSLINDWQAKQIIVKLSPGVNLSQLSDYDGMIEFVSIKGDLKEATLRLDGHSSGTMATLITENGVHHWVSELQSPEHRLSEPRGWLIEPDASIIRAGLVQDMALAFDGHQLDESIAYFTTDSKPDTAWLRSWQIMDWLPFNLKKLRSYLRQRDIGKLTIKKRGSPLEPEQLITKLKLNGKESCTIILTKYKGRPIAIICKDYVVG
jgi:SAM-dependent methyltransferase